MRVTRTIYNREQLTLLSRHQANVTILLSQQMLRMAVNIRYLNIQTHELNFFFSETFYMRLRALGECGLNKLQQFAVLSYKPDTVKKNFAGYPQRIYPDYAQKFHNDPVVSFEISKC